MEISRRNLLIASAAALPGRFFGASATEEGNGLWYQRLRRCAQHNLSEYDPKILEIEPWVSGEDVHRDTSTGLSPTITMTFPVQLAVVTARTKRKAVRAATCAALISLCGCLV